MDIGLWRGAELEMISVCFVLEKYWTKWASFVLRLVYGAAMGPERKVGGCRAGGVAPNREFF